MGISYSEVAKEMQALLRTDWSKNVSYAVKLKDLGNFCGQSTGDYYDREQSNGEVLWIIIRPDPSGVPSLITMMFRRKNQLSAAKAMDVDKLVSAKELMKEKSPRA